MAGGEIKFMDFMGLGPDISLTLVVFSEGLCAALLVLGLFTRWASIPFNFHYACRHLESQLGCSVCRMGKSFVVPDGLCMPVYCRSRAVFD